MYGDGSSGPLNITSGTTNLNLNQKYQFTTVNVAAGATLSTASSSGSVMYILATESVTINGSLLLNGKVNTGSNSWSITIDGETYSSPGVAAGGAGGPGLADGDTQSSGGAQASGFGGGGGGGGRLAYGFPGGAGGSGGPIPSGGTSVTVSGSAVLPGVAGSQSKGGSGGAGSGGAGGVATSGAGGSTFSANGTNASTNNPFPTSVIAGGGGGTGGSAGRAGVHLVIKAPTVIIGGSVVTSGTAGGNGGAGGAGSVNASAYPQLNGGAGGGGGGGNAGSVQISTSNYSLTGTILRDGGASGTGYIAGVAGATGALSITIVLSPSDSTITSSSTGSIVLETINIFPSNSAIATSSDFVSLAQDYELLASDSTLSTTSTGSILYHSYIAADDGQILTSSDNVNISVSFVITANDGEISTSSETGRVLNWTSLGVGFGIYRDSYRYSGELAHGNARYLLFEDPFLFLGEDNQHLMVAEQGLESESLIKTDGMFGVYSSLARQVLQWENLFLFLGEDGENLMQPEQNINDDLYKESNIIKGTFTT